MMNNLSQIAYRSPNFSSGSAASAPPILLTGASSGLGKALAVELARQSPNRLFILCGRDSIALIDTCNLIEELAVTQILALTEDLSTAGSAERLYGLIEAEGIEPGLVILNAGFGIVGLFEKYSIAEIERLLSVNVVSVTNLCRLCFPALKSTQGQLVLIGSTGAYQPGPYTSVYYAAKSYLRSLSYALAREWKKDNIAVSLIAPGAMKTAFAIRAGREASPAAMDPDQAAKRIIRAIEKRPALFIPGFANKVLVLVTRSLPGPWSAYFTEKVQAYLQRRRQ